MLLDPTGKALGVDIVLHQLPVRSYILPGLFLLAVMGLVPLFLVYSLLARPEWKWMDKILGWAPYHWGWTGTLLLVAVLAIWLLVEGLLIGMYPITYVTAIQGAAILLTALLPGVRRYYRRDGT